MKNIITALIEFSFRGKKFAPTLTLELDGYMQAHGRLPNLYPLIATENHIDHYSYEYEMMQVEPIKIAYAEGLVVDFVVDGSLATSEFEQAWREQATLAGIESIVKKNMSINDLQEHPGLRETLLEVYRLGANTPRTS